MAIKVSCEECGQSYTLADSTASKKLRCKTCGGTIQVPLRKPVEDFADAEVLDDEETFEFEQAPRRASARSSTRRNVASGDGVAKIVKLVLGLVAAFIAFIVAAVIGLFVMLRNGGGGPPPPPQPVAQDFNPPPIGVVPPVIPQPAQPNPVAPTDVATNPTTPQKNETTSAPTIANGNTNPAPVQPVVPMQPVVPVQPPANPQTEQIATLPLSAENAPKPPIWNVVPDFGAAAAKIESAKWNVRIGPNNLAEAAAFAPHGAPFVAFGDQYREVWDLRSGQRSGVITGLQNNVRTCVSPDGQWLATLASNKELSLYNAKTGELAKKVTAPDGNVKIFDFAGSNRIVAVNFFTHFAVFSTETLDLIAQGKPERKSIAGDTQAISPGGKYLAAMSSDLHVVVWDLSTGQEIGDMTLFTAQQRPNPKALAFSPDGAELAGLFEAPGGKGSNLVVWDIASARTMASLAFPGGTLISLSHQEFGRKSPPIQWFPDRSKWLIYGSAIVDRATGGAVWNVPEDQRRTRNLSRHLVGDGLVAVVEGDRNARQLAAIEVPLDELRRGAELIAAGGVAADAKLPPFTKADWSVAKLLNLSAAVDWRVPVAAVTPTPKLLPQPIAVPYAGLVVQGARVSSGPAAKLAVMETSSGVLQSGQPAEHLHPHLQAVSGNKYFPEAPAARLSLFDAVDGSAAPVTTALNYPAELMSLSPGGTRALVRVADGQDRLDIWNAAESQHELGWRPYLAEEKGPNVPSSKQALEFAEFAGESHVVTLNRNGRKLAIWKLPECRVLFSIENVSAPTIDPSGQILAVVFAQTINLFHVATGEKIGNVILNGTPQTLSFTPDGSRLAALYLSPGATMLAMIDLATGQLAADFPLPMFAQRMHWCGADHLLIGERQLLDVKREMVVATYDMTVHGQHLLDSPDGRHWFVAPKAINDATLVINAVALPDSVAAQLIAKSNPKRETLLQPGASVSLQVNVFDPPTKSGFSGTLKQKLTDSFSRHQIKVATGAPVAVTVSMTERATGRDVEYRTIGPGFGRPGGSGVTKIAVKEVECVVTFVHGNEKLSEYKQTFSNAGSFFENLPAGETIEKHLTKRMHEAATNYLLNFGVPKFVFPPSAVNGLSRWQFNANGIAPLPLPQSTPAPVKPPGLRT